MFLHFYPPNFIVLSSTGFNPVITDSYGGYRFSFTQGAFTMLYFEIPEDSGMQNLHLIS